MDNWRMAQIFSFLFILPLQYKLITPVDFLFNWYSTHGRSPCPQTLGSLAIAVRPAR